MFAPQTLSFNPLSRMPLGMGELILAQRPRGINSHLGSVYSDPKSVANKLQSQIASGKLFHPPKAGEVI
jgi:hypothetical protein